MNVHCIVPVGEDQDGAVPDDTVYHRYVGDASVLALSTSFTLSPPTRIPTGVTVVVKVLPKYVIAMLPRVVI